ncbi:MAG TPA: NAD(P)-binding domain-containing protein [Acidimicrobiales bacterium]|nr:NAD(P)-binding domain-containing protein [Acidimicrobiales bacterium]
MTVTRPGAEGTSPFDTSVAPITASDDEIRAFLAEAEVPPLLPAVAYATGDLSLLRDDLRPDPMMVAMPQGGLGEDQLAAARELAAEALIRFREGGSQPAAPPPDDVLLRIMEHAVGGAEMAAYLPLLEEELAYRGEDRRAPAWHKDDVAPDVDFRVAVIGAGMSGLLVAHRLKQAGVPFVILEKDTDVGGTWFENTYPGCRVDNPNHNYSYAFAQRHDWPLHFSTQDVLLDYFRHCADAFGLRPHIRFGTEVVSAEWSDADGHWRVRARTGDGEEETLTAQAVVSAVGQLNRPRYPTEIEGYGSFAGPAFHSARWDHTVDLAGKRVAVIGTGASAVQFIPEVAPAAGELLVFQRTPPWLAPTPDYHDEVSPGLRWLYRHVPSYSEFNRFWIFWRMGDGALDGVRVDEAWEPKGLAVSAANDFARMIFTAYMQVEFADRPDLLEAVLPTYPVGAKRILRDNGIWARTLKRENVRLVTDSIVRITPTGIVTADGVEHEVDVLLYGTGFTASAFLTPMRVRGRDGKDLHEQWGGDARAYLGITVPGFPNLFCLYGPNTNIVVNGSIVYFSECGVRYILGCLGLLLRSRKAQLDVRKDVHDEFNERVDAENRAMAWGWSDVNSWYKNAQGRVSQNWPFTLLEYWQRTREPDPDDFVLS